MIPGVPVFCKFRKTSHTVQRKADWFLRSVGEAESIAHWRLQNHGPVFSIVAPVRKILVPTLTCDTCMRGRAGSSQSRGRSYFLLNIEYRLAQAENTVLTSQATRSGGSKTHNKCRSVGVEVFNVKHVPHSYLFILLSLLQLHYFLIVTNVFLADIAGSWVGVRDGSLTSHAVAVRKIWPIEAVVDLRVKCCTEDGSQGLQMGDKGMLKAATTFHELDLDTRRPNAFPRR